MVRINWKHAVIGLVLGVLIALFVAGELNGGVISNAQGSQAGIDR